MDNKKLGSFIAELRKEQGLKQKELADKLSITDKAVSKWETGRGVPDVSILVPLCDILGVSVTELLNGEKSSANIFVDDKDVIKKLKVKKCVRYVIEAIITIIMFYGLSVYYDTYKTFGNVLDLCLHINEIHFISIYTIAMIVIIILWLLIVVISAITKSKASVIKTIIICSMAFFVLGTSVHMATLEENRYLEQFDQPIDTVNYIHYDEFFSDDFETQISIKDTNEKILANYTCLFDGKTENKDGIFDKAYTYCITANDTLIVDSLYKQEKRKYDKADIIELNTNYLEKIDAREGYYIKNQYSNNDFLLVFLRDNSYYEITISNVNISDDKLIKSINRL